MNSFQKSLPQRIALVAFGFIAAGSAQAADPFPQPQPYPQQQYPQPQYPQQQFQQQPADQNPMRAMFASSLAQVAQTTGNAAVVALADGLTGALMNWFDSKRQRKRGNGAMGNLAPTTTPPANYQPGSAPVPGGYPTPGADAGYPAPNSGDTGGYPTPGADDTGGYPAQGGYPATSNYPTTGGYPTPGTTPAPTPPALYAGIAFEVHLLQPNGATQAVDPANYTFRTGEQFRVYYRPSLPGRVDVFNINAAGSQAQIDSSVVAAGELASLGPYEFTQLKGDETLILKLTPCATPATYVVTRNIVKVQPTQDATRNNLGFNDCSNTATRGVRPKTRDIRKVAVEGGTSFALDPIGANELGGGDMAPRQITITLMHR